MMKCRGARVGKLLGAYIVGMHILSGCATGAGDQFRVQLYDKNKATMTAGIKGQYVKADVTGIIELEKKNLDTLLVEELKVIRENHKLQVDFALLEIADNDTPMAETYTKEAKSRLAKLGFKDGFKEVRAVELKLVDVKMAIREMDDRRSDFKGFMDKLPAADRVTLPECKRNPPIPETLSYPDSLKNADLGRVKETYKKYRAACQKFRNNYPKWLGQIGETLAALEAAQAEVRSFEKSVKAAKEDKEKKEADYNKVKKQIEEIEKRGETAGQNLKNKAEKLKNKIEMAQGLITALSEAGDPGGQIKDAQDKLDGIVTLLTAAAGGEIKTNNEDIKKAANIVGQIPSLNGDIQELLGQAQMPSVNNLLVEMRHQVLLLENAKKRRSLVQERADILKTKYEALKKEPKRWLEFGDAICSYAMLKGDKEFPGESCDDFKVKQKDDKWVCSVPPDPNDPNKPTTVEDCILEKPWKEIIRNPGNSKASRELYKALAAYLRALALQEYPSEQDFRLIDVRHREMLVSRETAIRGWDNLVAVPISQLDAYYQSGVKPAEIADLLVKALGFTAIAIGVSQ